MQRGESEKGRRMVSTWTGSISNQTGEFLPGWLGNNSLFGRLLLSVVSELRKMICPDIWDRKGS